MKSFQDAAKDIASDTPPVTVASAPTATTTTTTAVARPLPDDGGFSGEMDKSDIVMPRLAIVQRVGELADDFPPGTILLNKRLVLAEPGGEVVLTVLRARKYFMEIRPYGDEVRPRVFATHAETLAAGFTLEPNWSTGEKATAKPALDCVVAVHGGKEVASAPEFTLVHDNQPFALAAWSINSASAYKEAGKTLLSAKQLYLKRFAQQSWRLTSDKVKFGANTVFIPRVVPAAANAEARADWLDSLV